MLLPISISYARRAPTTALAESINDDVTSESTGGAHTGIAGTPLLRGDAVCPTAHLDTRAPASADRGILTRGAAAQEPRALDRDSLSVCWVVERGFDNSSTSHC